MSFLSDSTQRISRFTHHVSRYASAYLALCAILLLALALRLLVWHWREFYPLGGDEQEYLGQALTLLREHRYVELQLMRPPLYGVFLAGWIYFVDSLVQNLRLVHAGISAATVIPVWLLTAELVRWYNITGRLERFVIPGIAALLCALSYTLAANATELLTETLFLFGLTTFFWLLLKAGRLCTRSSQKGIAQQQAEHDGQHRRDWRHRVTVSPCHRVTIAAGVALGLLCLTRSVALPLLPLGALWLLGAAWKGLVGQAQAGQAQDLPLQSGIQNLTYRITPALIFTLTALLIILPWTARNYVTYGGLIVIDTTGAENLWLDNDPAGREVVKAQLYALGEDRVARQQLATQRGLANITADPQRFLTKAWGEVLGFFALEYTDDMRARRAIWVPPAEVWTRLLLGDGLWLALILVGTFGLSRFAVCDCGLGKKSRNSQHLQSNLLNPAWLFILWALYIVLTAMVFHVELRYRLPLYPVLLPYAALALADRRPRAATRRWLAYLPSAGILLLTLLHAPYPALAWQLGWKHFHLAQAERALTQGDQSSARAAGQAALQRDPESVLARVALARAAILAEQQDQAEDMLRDAINILPAHPQPHLLLGDLLRQQEAFDGARYELSYETASLQDLQTWSWAWFTTPPQPALDVGGGLDLGMVQGFHATEAGGWRWTRSRARIRLATSVAPPVLYLRLASGRPADAPAPQVEVWADGQFVGSVAVASGWHDYVLPLTQETRRPGDRETGAPGQRRSVAATHGAESAVDGQFVHVELRSATFTPRDYDRASSDGRELGVMVDRVEVVRDK